MISFQLPRVLVGRAHGKAGHTRRGAFTLIELLVVVAIISVLIAMLLPALSKARQMAVRTQCASNMRQCFLGLYMYASDNRGRLPTMGNALTVGAGGYWTSEITSTSPDLGMSYLLQNYFNNNYYILFCPGWLQNTVFYAGSPVLAQRDGDAKGVAEYWWDWTTYAYNLPPIPPGSPYPNGYIHIVGYEFLCNGAINGATSATSNVSAFGFNTAVIPPYPPMTVAPGIASPYYCASTKESASKVLIADETAFIGPWIGYNDQNGWNNWAVSHTTQGNKPFALPQGANHCNLDGSVSWNGGSDLQARYFLYNGEQPADKNNMGNMSSQIAQYQWWW